MSYQILKTISPIITIMIACKFIQIGNHEFCFWYSFHNRWRSNKIAYALYQLINLGANLLFSHYEIQLQTHQNYPLCTCLSMPKRLDESTSQNNHTLPATSWIN